MEKACNVHNAVLFVSLHAREAGALARKLKMPTENILGLAAHECKHGEGRFADKGNNFFSMHAPAPFQIGTITALRDPKVKMAVFPNFKIACNSFDESYGEKLHGISDAGDFSRALVTIGFNSGKSSNGGTDGYAKKVEDSIRMVKIRLERCI
ncbi:glucosaminidase domain-containing protein [Massilia rubra]|uniref:Mannosyl-glycoprotein endo-beta-N-acetylglucosamidase-like domain-containing protein n=1 Tax=Massilia rubra TaxID=2607910 RepID=A0ABX0LNJ8_9BURK|nr:glucosaminidase domain-containing protein [Massilia rubra]NHZ35960.1 hypothetical protein [Massilia rubra]